MTNIHTFRFYLIQFSAIYYTFFSTFYKFVHEILKSNGKKILLIYL